MTHMRGKKSVLLDIGSPDGRKLFEDLVCRSMSSSGMQPTVK